MRKIVQFSFLALFILLIALSKWPPPQIDLLDAFLKIDPLLSIQSSLSSGKVAPGLALGLLLLGMTLLLGRFFCGWLCPMGTCLEYGDSLLYRKKKRLWNNRDRKLRGLKYLVLIAVLLAALMGENLVYWFDPISWMTRLFTWLLWPLFSLLGNALLDLTRPLLEGLGWMNLARMELTESVIGVFGLLTLAFFIFLFWLGRWQRRLWCRSLCPLGALLGLAARFSIFGRKVSDACDACSRCAVVCETGAIPKEYEKTDEAECIRCGKCETDCKTEAVTFAPGLPRPSESNFDLNRRQVLTSLGAGFVGSIWLANNPARLAGEYAALRPPGSIPEADFLSACIRCGHCVKICPTHCLQPALHEGGPAGLMTPITRMRLGPCDPNCNACTLICPTDAIRPVELLEKTYARIGVAVIDQGRCIVWEQGKVCLVCDENCPYGAISWKANEQGHRVPSVEENHCNGCGQCEHACPIDGQAAIRVHSSGNIRLNEGSYVEEAAVRGLKLESRKGGYGGY